jgi:hypothetical protein
MHCTSLCKHALCFNQKVSIFYPCTFLCSRSASRSGLSTRCDTLGLRARQVVGRDPGLIVGHSTAGDSRAISTDNADLVGRVDLLGTARGALGTLTALAATLLLGEEGGDPGVVDEEDGTSEDTGEDKVEEDAAGTGQSLFEHTRCARVAYI